MSNHLLESYIAFQQLQEEAKEAGLTLEYSGRKFTLIAGESRKVKDLNGTITDRLYVEPSVREVYLDSLRNYYAQRFLINE